MFINKLTRLSTKHLSTKNFKHKALVIEKFGDPLENVRLQTFDSNYIFPKELKPDQVFLKHLAAPVNPADINLIQGVYGVKPCLPTALGNEGVAEVAEIGSKVKDLSIGDHVIFTTSFSKSWQTHSIVPSTQLLKVDKRMNTIDAAQLKVNPVTAYLMLKNYTDLKPGDSIIQNGANSACGVFVIQLAKAWGLKSINVVRDRPERDQLVNELNEYGADVVVTESEVSKVEVTKDIAAKIGKPKLALNCVGGKNAVDCSRLLANDAAFVTYGAMSKKRIELAASPQIFKNHTYYGHWTTRYFEQNSREDIKKLINELTGMFIDGSLKSKPTKHIELEDYKLAFENAANIKYMFVIKS